MNTTKQLQQIKLDQWAVLCKEQSKSGLTVKQWCDQNGYTIHTYNYWKHRLKENYVESALHDIVPITPPVPGVLHESRESHDSGITNTISILLGNTTISLDAAIINGKYNNHLPLERQSRCYNDSGVTLETNIMSNWMMRAAEIHLNILYEELHRLLT